ncbi:uncharacterized protein LOC113300507 [Papaver somniferum]|uniref:uncharacterized protein LOC113300507 n=1 Tax=Papaver somniferum TaxID=3469 RepID=UPI000E6F5E90|nr:uncharacterized protein LOC113300507 [Papaver somniferum]
MEFHLLWNASGKLYGSSSAMPMLSIFLWLLAHGRTLVMDNMRRRGLDISSICPLCYCEEDTISHLFLTSQRVIHIWSAFSDAYRINIQSSNLSIWCNRNSLIYSNKTFDWRTVIHTAYNAAYVYSRATINSLTVAHEEPIYVRLLPPNDGYVKLNVDESSNDAGHASRGIFREDDGHFMDAFA